MRKIMVALITVATVVTLALCLVSYRQAQRIDKTKKEAASTIAAAQLLAKEEPTFSSAPEYEHRKVVKALLYVLGGVGPESRVLEGDRPKARATMWESLIHYVLTESELPADKKDSVIRALTYNGFLSGPMDPWVLAHLPPEEQAELAKKMDNML